MKDKKFVANMFLLWMAPREGQTDDLTEGNLPLSPIKAFAQHPPPPPRKTGKSHPKTKEERVNVTADYLKYLGALTRISTNSLRATQFSISVGLYVCLFFLTDTHFIASLMAFSGIDLEKPSPLHISVGLRDSAVVGLLAIAFVARNFCSS